MNDSEQRLLKALDRLLNAADALLEVYDSDKLRIAVKDLNAATESARAAINHSQRADDSEGDSK